jgi:hypothetical protein
MRTFSICIATIAVALAGCTVKETVVRPAEPAPPVVYQQAPATTGAPRIAYTVTGQDQYDDAAEQAASWCNSNYGSSGAHLIDRTRSTAGDVVTYECTMS